jgi:hypothetical protein
MTSDEFVTWLKGYLQALQSDKAEIKVILDKVAFVTSKTKPVEAGVLVGHVPPYPPYPLKTYKL